MQTAGGSWETDKQLISMIFEVIHKGMPRPYAKILVVTGNLRRANSSKPPLLRGLPGGSLHATPIVMRQQHGHSHAMLSIMPKLPALPAQFRCCVERFTPQP